MNESLDAMTPARPNRAQVATFAAEQSAPLLSVDEDMPTGYHEALFEAVGHDIEENVHDKHCWENTDALTK